MKIRYYKTPGGGRPVEEFIMSLPQSTRLEVFDAISLLDSGKTLRMPLSKNLSSIRPGLHELRLRDEGGQIRVIYFLQKHVAIYLIHGFRKKTQEIPRKELAVILRRLKEI